jgi:PAS domain S-box-containing protein
MRIKTQFIICIVVFSIILIVIATSVTNTEQQVAQLNAQEQIASNIERGASSLNTVSVDYFLYQEDLQVSKWQLQFSSLNSDLESLKPSNAQQITLANKTTGDLQRLNAIFGDVITYLQSAPRNVSIRIDPAFQIRWSAMAGQSLALASDAAQLSSSLDKQAHQINETNILLIVSLVGTFGALLATIYLMVFRRTLKSVSELQKGINTIGLGNLEYVIETKRQDEISELSHSFNKMTANLKEVTASKTDLEQAQTSLRESEQRWAITLESIGDAVIATDLTGKIRFMNGVAECLTGWTLNEASLKPVKEIFKIVNEQTRLGVEDPVGKVLEKGMIVGLANHTVLIRKDSTEVPIDDSGAPIKDKEGKTMGVVLIFRDITERKKNEEAIRESEERFSKAFHNSPVPQIITRFGDWRYVDANESVLRLLEYSREELLGHTSAELNLIPLDKRDQSVRIVNDRGELRDFETEVQTKSGKIITVLSSTETITLNGQKHLINTFIDITQRKAMQAKLEEYSRQLENLVEKRTLSLKASEEKYRTLFDSIDEGFAIIEMVFDTNYKPLDYRFVEINAAFERQTGMHDARGKLMRSFAPNHEAYWFEIYGKVALTAEPIRFTNEAKALNRWYDVYAFPVGEGKIRKVGILFNDISQRKNLEKQLKDSERLAAIGATAGMVGHDIRNPLQAITGDLYLAKTELTTVPESPEKNNTLESLQEIEKNIDYINKIVADLQDFARPLKPHMEEADLKLIITELLAKNGLPQEVKVTVKVENSAIKVQADSAYLNRILYNLVTNAVQAMPKGGKLHIHAYKDKKTKDAVLTVEDTGVGIPEEAKNKLFTPMFTTKSKGQGFGLAVIKRMTEALSGNVTFESEEGKGTKFTVRFPQNGKKKTDF